jgi:hypothetical protein
MFFNFFKKHRHKNKGKKNKFTSSLYGKCSIGAMQMEAITHAVISKKRLFVFTESM